MIMENGNRHKVDFVVTLRKAKLVLIKIIHNTCFILFLSLIKHRLSRNNSGKISIYYLSKEDHVKKSPADKEKIS